MKITFDRAVLGELVDLAEYIGQNNEEAAFRFLDAADAAFAFLLKNKFAGAPKNFSNTLLSDVRMWRIKGFDDYLIFYRFQASGIRILHVFHSSRDWNGIFEDEAR